MELREEYQVLPEVTKKALRRQETLTGNPLSVDVIYMQRFELLADSQESEFEEKVENYAKELLNDDAIGIVFFKVRIFTNKGVKNEDSIRVGDQNLKREYILHFHAFSVEYLTKTKVDKIGQKWKDTLKDGNGQELATLKETQLMIHNKTFPRKPTYM